MDLINRRTGKHATKHRALGLLGHIGAVANEIKHVHSPEVIVVLDPRYD